MTTDQIQNVVSEVSIRYPDIKWDDLMQAETEMQASGEYEIHGLLGQDRIVGKLSTQKDGSFELAIQIPNTQRDDLLWYEGHLFILTKFEQRVYLVMAQLRLICRLTRLTVLKAWSGDQAYQTLQSDWLSSFISFPVEMLVRVYRRLL